MNRSGLLFLAALATIGCTSGSNLIPGVDGSIDGATAPAPDSGSVRVDSGTTDAGRDAGPPIELVDTCESCVVHEQCGSLGRCLPLTDGEFACSDICNPDIPSCPRGFECVERVLGPGQHVPGAVGAVNGAVVVAGATTTATSARPPAAAATWTTTRSASPPRTATTASASSTSRTAGCATRTATARAATARTASAATTGSAAA